MHYDGASIVCRTITRQGSVAQLSAAGPGLSMPAVPAPDCRPVLAGMASGDRSQPACPMARGPLVLIVVSLGLELLLSNNA